MEVKEYTIYEAMKVFEVARSTIYQWAKKEMLEIITKNNKAYVIVPNDFIPPKDLKNKKTNSSVSDNKEYVIIQNLNYYKNKYFELEKANKDINAKYLEAKEKIGKLEKEILVLSKLNKVNKNDEKTPSNKENFDIVLEKINELSSKIENLIKKETPEQNEEKKTGILGRIFK